MKENYNEYFATAHEGTKTKSDFWAVSFKKKILDSVPIALMRQIGNRVRFSPKNCC